MCNKNGIKYDNTVLNSSVTGIFVYVKMNIYDS